jgi:hypothetical protein
MLGRWVGVVYRNDANSHTRGGTVSLFYLDKVKLTYFTSFGKVDLLYFI